MAIHGHNTEIRKVLRDIWLFNSKLKKALQQLEYLELRYNHKIPTHHPGGVLNDLSFSKNSPAPLLVVGD